MLTRDSQVSKQQKEDLTFNSGVWNIGQRPSKTHDGCGSFNAIFTKYMDSHNYEECQGPPQPHLWPRENLQGTQPQSKGSRL